MALNRQRSEEGSVDDYGTGLTDELAALRRGAGEMMVIRTLQRLMRPIFVPILRPLIHQFVKDEIELAKQELMIIMKESPENKEISSVLRKLKLQFRNKIGLPVFTGTPLVGENQTPIEIALVDALSGERVITGDESAANLEILGFRVGDDDGDDGDDCGNWTYADLQERIMSERKGKRILQGDTRLQLKEGVALVHKIKFTHNSTHTRNGAYRLAAVVVDADLMNKVGVAWTETFVMKDGRYKYHEKHPCPALSDKVCRLQQIGYGGARDRRLRDAKVYTVKDLLELLYTDPTRLENVLELKASSKSWDEIVKNALASDGMFLYLDPRNELKSGVVLDVKLQLKAVIVDSHMYIAVNQLSEQQKEEAEDLVKFASEHLNMLHDFDHETSLQEYLQSRPAFTSSPSATQRGKEKAPFDDEMIPSTNDHHDHIMFHPHTPNGLNFGTATEPGTSYDSLLDTCERMLTDDSLLNEIWGMANESPNECQAICAIARERWTKVSKLLRRNSVRERISLSQGIQPLKKQRCC